MLTPSDLAVVIPSHNQLQCLESCLQSLTEFGGREIQIVVVDDGSPGAGVSALAGKFAGIMVIRNEVPQGFSKAVNSGIRQTSRKVVQLLNDDARVTPGWFEAPLRAFSRRIVGAVAPLVLMDGAQPEKVDSAGDRFTFWGLTGKNHHGAVCAGKGPGDFRRRSAKWVLGASASSAFYRRSALENVGLMDEDFGAYFEDLDLALRLNKGGWRIWHEPASVVYHRVSSSYGRSPSPEVLRMQSRNEERLFWRHIPPPWLYAGFPVHVAALGAKFLRHLWKGQSLPFVFGKCDAWREVLMDSRKRPKPPVFGSGNPWQWGLDLF